MSTSRILPQDTHTVSTHLLLPPHCNALGTAFGGQLMAWIDICAAVSARRFAKGSVVTASMDQLDFECPVRLGDILILMGQVNWSGRTSMEVGVRAEVEDPRDGSRRHVATAYLTFVHVDEHGRPTPVPTLAPNNESDQRRYDAARIRREDRLRTAKRLQAQAT